ncbi:hypothetical protein KPH14_011622 [Odynerus spinipes]|uniref:Uncharacterized protein n=1 Tax=Odynerus spinipes TaxID=1348599 RepID=A0AAD9RF39_9HYME|nr:hypothetical protein KPH14_011622 [Odynerus spinipes]
MILQKGLLPSLKLGGVAGGVAADGAVVEDAAFGAAVAVDEVAGEAVAEDAAENLIWLSKRTKSDRIMELYSFILNYFHIEDAPKKILETVRKKIMKFSYKLSEKWATSNRTKKRFLKNNVQWLGQEIEFHENSQEKPTSLRGPKKLSFTDSSNKTKRRRVQNLIDTSAKEEIIYAAQISLHATGQRDAAAILKQVTTTTPKRATRIKKVFHRESCKKLTIKDAQECRHKEVRRYREHNSRKYSRKATMEDIINMLFVTSDPLINSKRNKPQKSLQKISPEVLSLLLNPTSSTSSYDSDTDCEDYSSNSEKD